MKLFTIITFIGLTVTALTSTVAITEDLKSIDQLIAQLGSDVYKDRETASYQLWQKGEQSLPQLKIILNSDNPEQAMRAEILIRNIEMGALPSNDKKVISVIDRYRSTNSMTEKLRSLEELVKLNALKQVLFLLHWEKNDRVREELGRRKIIGKVAFMAAQQALSIDDIDEAIRLLRIAPKNAANYRALAHLLKYTGKLDAEIQTTQKLLPNKAAKSWLLALFRTNGKLRQAREIAQQTKNIEALATFSVLAGDPFPLLDYHTNHSSSSNHTIALNLLKRLHQQSNPADIHEVIAELAKRFDNEANEKKNLEYITRIALLMGDREVGEKLLTRYNQKYALNYYKSQECSKQEFELLDTPNPVTEAREFDTWLKKEIVREMDTDLELLSGKSSKIEKLAHFYFSRGETEQCLAILRPLLKALQDDGDDRWFQIVGGMPIYGMGEYVAKLAIERGNEDNTYLQLSYALFGNVEEIDYIWQQIKKLDASAQAEVHFRQLLQIMGVSHVMASNRKSSIENLLKSRLKILKGESRSKLLTALAFAAESRNDFVNMLCYYKELCKDRKLSEKPKFYLKYQLAASMTFDWKEIVASYDLKPESYINTPTRLARYAIAKRRLGENQLAEKLLNKAILHTLGETQNLNALAAVIHECEARKEAKEIWLNHIACLDVDSWEFYFTLSHINHQSRFAMAERDWKLATSFSLAEKIIFMGPTMRPTHYHVILRNGYTSTFTAGMMLLKQGNLSEAKKMLGYAHSILPGDGTLADDFFPNLIGRSLKKETAQWFETSWKHMEREITAYPKNHNAHNTIAWLGSRANMKLDDSLKHAKLALKAQPAQPAYLDTLAEIYFAKRDRKNAVKHSNEALEHIKSGAYAYNRNVNSATMYSELTQQNARFKKEAFPLR